MNLLDPKIGAKISPLIDGIAKERRHIILEIAKSATDRQEFEEKLYLGGFPIGVKGKI
jgi:hypothetical protein